jgi:hypothetical protein
MHVSLTCDFYTINKKHNISFNRQETFIGNK